MFTTTILFIVAVSSIKGHPLEATKPQYYYSKYFLNSRIVGGVDAPEGYGKHMAALVFGYESMFKYPAIPQPKSSRAPQKRPQPSPKAAMKCNTGSIGHQIVQFLDRSFRAIIGTKKWLTGTKEIHFIKYVLHPGWDSYTLKYDIGLLTVASDIHQSEDVAIVPLRFEWVDGGVNSYVTGWGQLTSMFDSNPKLLQLLYVWTLNHKDCKERMEIASEVLGSAPSVQEDVEICTLHSPGHGMCNGDSGSALVMKDTQEQIGIVSWGFPCAHGFPDVFVRLSKFEDWLRTNTQGQLA